MASLRSKVLRRYIKRSKSSLGIISDKNLQQKRQHYDHLAKYFAPEKSVTTEQINTNKFKGEWLKSPESRVNKVVLYFHGGGFVFGGNLHRDLTARIAKEAKVKALSVDYSLAPEHPYPAALNECFAAYEWLLKSYSPNDIALAGDSSGGAIVLSLLHMMKAKELPVPSCAVVIAPATDATLSGQSFTKNKNKDAFIKLESLEYFINAYFKNIPRNDPVGSPLYGSFKGFPPLLVHIDKSEIMYDDSARLVQKARKEGVEVEFYEEEGLWHVWHMYARYIPEAKKAIKNIAKFINKHYT